MNNTETLTTEDLIQACIARPIVESAWQEFWRRFHPIVLRRVRHVLRPFGSLHAIEEQDVVQFVFLKVFQKLSRFDPEKSSLEGYLNLIATHTVLDELRKVQRIPIPTRDDMDQLELPGPTMVDEAQLEGLVAAALSGLGAPKADMVKAYLEGESTRAICARVGVTPANLYKTVSRFRMEIRKLFQQETIEQPPKQKKDQ